MRSWLIIFILTASIHVIDMYLFSRVLFSEIVVLHIMSFLFVVSLPPPPRAERVNINKTSTMCNFYVSVLHILLRGSI